MDYRLDEKGKYYTTHVSKRAAPVVVSVAGALISGAMHLILDNRIKDELNGGERFVAITGAEVREGATGKLLYEAATVILNKDQIAWVVTTQESDESTGHHDDGADL